MGSASALGTHGPMDTIEHDGTTYTIRMLDFVTLTALGNWMLQQEAAAQAAGDMALVDIGLLKIQDVFDRKDKFIDDAVNAKRYAVGSKRFAMIMGTFDSALKVQGSGATEEQKRDAMASITEPVIKLISLLLRCDMDTAINLLHEKNEELMAKLSFVLAASKAPKAKGAAA